MTSTYIEPTPSTSSRAAPASTGPAANAPLVLLVEDDPRMRKYLHQTLTDQCLRVVETETGTEGLVQAAAHNPDLVVLDFTLPDLDGIQVTTRLREWSAAPILILSARDEQQGKVAALDAGANDYLTKPFSTAELLARIRVWLRHTQRAHADSLQPSLEVGELRIDFDKRLAYLRDQEVRLTPTQYKLFAMMMRNAGKVLTHEQLLLSVWGPSYTHETQYLRVYMGQIRRKFEADPARPHYFVTESGIGYRLRVE
ncbi:MAG TPA: response regulator [Polyangiaceae bacterium]|nr:response regulator [Polyangiaceae bacterium]